MSDLYENIKHLERSMNYHSKRHVLLSANIANVDTPGFRPRELAFNEVLESNITMQSTDRAHIDATGAGGKSGDGMSVYDDMSAQPGNDGNSVNLEQQLSKLSANGMRYKAVSEMLMRRLAMIRYAVSDGVRH